VCSRSGGPMLVIGTHPIHTSSTKLGNPQQYLEAIGSDGVGNPLGGLLSELTGGLSKDS
ncbi:MAG: hypothetical protein QOG47_1274, partial [Mycobacterium sp.]|nr:hypothetical protein [Mycobacterium sp.]